jgi:hypothetical protein
MIKTELARLRGTRKTCVLNKVHHFTSITLHMEMVL